MKIKALKIDRRFIVTSKDMVEKGVPLAYFVQAEIISKIIDEFNLKNPNSKVDPQKIPKWLNMEKVKKLAKQKIQK